MATTELIIDTINCFEDKVLPVTPELAVEPVVELEVEQAREAELVEEPAILQEEIEEEPPELVDAPDESDSEEEDDDDEPEEGIASRTRSQTGAVRQPTKRYTMASIKVQKGKETDPERVKKIEDAEHAEIELLFVDLCALKPVPEQKDAYRCHMFSVEKTLATGEHAKFKARLVFDGSEREAQLFPDKSSPTAALLSLMACLSLTAQKGYKKISKIDVKGAFIQTEMEGPPVFIQCDKNLTRLIVDILPGVKKFVTERGTLYCQLLKALRQTHVLCGGLLETKCFY